MAEEGLGKAWKGTLQKSCSVTLRRHWSSLLWNLPSVIYHSTTHPGKKQEQEKEGRKHTVPRSLLPHRHHAICHENAAFPFLLSQWDFFFNSINVGLSLKVYFFSYCCMSKTSLLHLCRRQHIKFPVGSQWGKTRFQIEQEAQICGETMNIYAAILLLLARSQLSLCFHYFVD